MGDEDCQGAAPEVNLQPQVPVFVQISYPYSLVKLTSYSEAALGNDQVEIC